MRPLITVGVLGLAALCASTAAAAPIVEIRDAAARVLVIPEMRSDVIVTLASGRPGLPIVVRRIGDRVTVSGNLARRTRGCRIAGGRRGVSFGGRDGLAYEQLPQLIVHTPADVRLIVRDAVYGSIAPSRSVEFTNLGCGDWMIADVIGRLRLSQAGAGDTQVGGATAADLSVEGAGDVRARSVRGPLSVISSGSGMVSVGEVTGAVDARVAGPGSIVLAGGDASRLSADIAGSGSIRFGGVARALNVAIAGSGSVTVAKVAGPVAKQVFGSGVVRIGR